MPQELPLITPQLSIGVMPNDSLWTIRPPHVCLISEIKNPRPVKIILCDSCNTHVCPFVLLEISCCPLVAGLRGTAND